MIDQNAARRGADQKNDNRHSAKDGECLPQLAIILTTGALPDDVLRRFAKLLYRNFIYL